MKPLPEDWVTRVSYKNATYEEIVERYCSKIHLPTTNDKGLSCGQESENILHALHYMIRPRTGK
jgi:hypothetical protein